MMKFRYYEEVIIRSEEKSLDAINGSKGVIVSEPSETTITVYIQDLDECWMIDARDLKSTGRIYSHEDFYDGTQISVNVNSKGEGRIE